MTRLRLVVLVTLALSCAGVPTAHAAESPLSEAFKRSAALPRVQVLLTGRCEQADARPARCSVRVQSDRAAGYHYYRAFLSGSSLRMLRVAGRNHMDTGFLNLIDEDGEKSPPCWISEDRPGLTAEESFSFGPISAGATLRSLARDLRAGTITRTGRTITRVRGGERASFTLDAKGRVESGVIEDPEDGRFRLTITYPAEPFEQITPTPACTDEQLDD